MLGGACGPLDRPVAAHAMGEDMPFIHDDKRGANANVQQNQAPGRRAGLRGMGAAEGAQALSPQGPGKLSVQRGVADAARVLRPDPRKPETCKLPVRILGTESLQALGGNYEQLLTLVFIRVMDLFRAFGIQFNLILGGTAKDGDVLIDAGQAGGPMPQMQDPSMLMGPGGAPGPIEVVPPMGPGRQPTRPDGGPGIITTPPTRVPPQLPDRDGEPTRPGVPELPTREPPQLPERDLEDEVDRNWPTVAENETARVWGDPHFVGADGGKFDVQGEAGKTYNLLSDTGLQLFGTFDGWGDGITVVGSTGLTVTGRGGTSQIHFNAKEDRATVNGQAITQGKSTVLADGGTVKRVGKDLITNTAEGYRIVQHDQGKHIDAEVHSGDRGVHNGSMPTGLMGCTFDADKDRRDGKKGKGAQGEGAIEGVVGDHEVDGGVFGQLKSAAIKGDIDGDGVVSLQDAHAVMMHAMGHGSLTEPQQRRADVDDDGTVSMADAIFILRMAQQASGMSRISRPGNGKPIQIPKDGNLTLSVLSFSAMHQTRIEAMSPSFRFLFGNADVSGQVGQRDSYGAVKRGQELNVGARADALGVTQLYDLKQYGETFEVKEMGEGHWRVHWNGPALLSKGDFSSLIFDVNLAPKQAGT